MKKRNLALLIIVAAVVALVACDSDKKTEEGDLSEDPDNHGNSQMGIANPWIDTDAAYISEKLSKSFGEPEDAEKVIYRWCESVQLAEMRYEKDGIQYNARIQKAEGFTDISGLYCNWPEDNCGHAKEDVLFGITGQYRAYSDGTKTFISALWFDEENAFMYSLSCESNKGAIDLSDKEVIFK